MTRHIVPEPLGHYGKWNTASHRRTKTVEKKKKKRCIGIHLAKEVDDLYTEKYKSLIKEPEKTQTNVKIFCVHGF